jgi:hypothetical protein
MGNRVSKFQRGSGAFVCRKCGRRTRETGDCESGVGLCARCFEMCGLENTIEDSEVGSDAYNYAVDRLAQLKAEV